MSPYNTVFILLLSCSAIYADSYPNNPGPPPHHPPPLGSYPDPVPHRPPSKVKPGVCQPNSPRCRFIQPKGQCNDDGDCERNLKCCTTYCVPQCLPPMPERPGRPRPPFRGNDCPRYPDMRCQTPWLQNECDTDRTCKRNEKCCQTPCNKVCMNV